MSDSLTIRVTRAVLEIFWPVILNTDGGAPGRGLIARLAIQPRMVNLVAVWIPGALVRLGDLHFVITAEGALEPIDAPTLATSAAFAVAIGDDLRAPGERLRFGSLDFIIFADGTPVRIRAPALSVPPHDHAVDLEAGVLAGIQLDEAAPGAVRDPLPAGGETSSPLCRLSDLLGAPLTQGQLDAVLLSVIDASIQLVGGVPTTGPTIAASPSAFPVGMANIARVYDRLLKER